MPKSKTEAKHKPEPKQKGKLLWIHRTLAQHIARRLGQAQSRLITDDYRSKALRTLLVMTLDQAQGEVWQERLVEGKEPYYGPWRQPGESPPPLPPPLLHMDFGKQNTVGFLQRSWHLRFAPDCNTPEEKTSQTVDSTQEQPTFTL